jgi:hypothetical protein
MDLEKEKEIKAHDRTLQSEWPARLVNYRRQRCTGWEREGQTRRWPNYTGVSGHLLRGADLAWSELTYADVSLAGTQRGMECWPNARARQVTCDRTRLVHKNPLWMLTRVDQTLMACHLVISISESGHNLTHERSGFDCWDWVALVQTRDAWQPSGDRTHPIRRRAASGQPVVGPMALFLDVIYKLLGVCPRGYHRDDCIALYPWHIMSPLNIH